MIQNCLSAIKIRTTRLTKFVIISKKVNASVHHAGTATRLLKKETVCASTVEKSFLKNTTCTTTEKVIIKMKSAKTFWLINVKEPRKSVGFHM